MRVPFIVLEFFQICKNPNSKIFLYLVFSISEPIKDWAARGRLIVYYWKYLYRLYISVENNCSDFSKWKTKLLIVGVTWGLNVSIINKLYKRAGKRKEKP